MGKVKSQKIKIIVFAFILLVTNLTFGSDKNVEIKETDPVIVEITDTTLDRIS